MKPRVLFYVQHLLGIGHMVRGARIARALVRCGFHVDLVLGGVPIEGLDVGGASIVQLPPVKATVGFSKLLDPNGEALSEVGKAKRRDQLLGAFAATQPDIVLIEAFPFARRQMDFELLPLLECARAASHRPLVAVSIRDILQRNRKRGRSEEAVEIVERNVDLVLVHGDPRLVRLSETFPLADRFAARTAYTGMVAPEPDGLAPVSEHDVIVSAGGGAVGGALLRAALAARPRTELTDARWLVVTGPNMQADAEAAARRLAGEGVSFARFVPDLPQRLSGAALSISQAGYNTVADVLASGCRSILVPFAAEGETEQTDRARLIQARGRAIMVEESSLDADRLVAAIARVRMLPPPQTDIDLGGAAATASLLMDKVAARWRLMVPSPRRPL
ncbi:MAG: glycosyl transferase [Methylobacteriaceae bacterium]|nr:glycosyl transferase [Methylobacteriaceae bacterium]